jgi:hypothetical protein
MQHSHPSEDGIKRFCDELLLINTTIDNLYRNIDTEINALLEADAYGYEPYLPAARVDGGFGSTGS